MSQNHHQLAAAIEVRHMQMIALGGVIGTGLFVSSGYTVQAAGGLGAVLAYLVGAILVYCVMLCLAELAAAKPSTGAFVDYASEYINPSAGFCVAVLYWLTWTIALGSEFTAAGLLLQKWFPTIPVWCFSLGLIIVILASNLFSVKIFAESEFWLALIKVGAIIFFIIVGILAILGILPYQHQHGVGLKNFYENGLFPNGIAGVFLTMLSVNFAFSGTELIGVTAGEATNPKVAIPKAIHQTLWRLICFFVGAIFVMAALIPANAASVAQSPFVVVFEKINLPAAADIMNFVILSAIISAANSGLYAATRMLFTLADHHQIPAFIAKTNQRKIPVYAVWLSMAGGLLSLFSSVYAASSVYLILVSVSGLAVVFVWMAIAYCHLQFRKQLDTTAIATLPYHFSHAKPVALLALFGSGLSCALLVFDESQRDALFISVIFVAFLYLGHRFFFKHH